MGRLISRERWRPSRVSLLALRTLTAGSRETGILDAIDVEVQQILSVSGATINEAAKKNT
jgi:hypothetical protein